MKKNRFVLVLVGLVLLMSLIAGCENGPKPGPVAKGEVLLAHKGTAYGVNLPKWVEIAVGGTIRDLEKLPEYKDKVVFLGKAEAQNLPSAELFASRMSAQTDIAAYLSTRVKDAFKGANVADADSKNFGQYGERFVASVAEAKYSGFRMENDWWVHVQTFTPEGKPDKQIYRVLQLWTMEKAMLQKQFDIILGQLAGTVPQTPESKRAMDLVQNTYIKDFFGEQ